MTSILIVGAEAALLEGMSQTFIAAGHRVIAAKELSEVSEVLNGIRPLVAVVHRDILLASGSPLRIALAEGGALLAFHEDDAEATGLPFRLRRATLAELRLPLEKQRLMALVRYVESRARAAGRGTLDDDAPEIEAR